MGHKRTDEAMIYVRMAENHRREIPACVLKAGQVEADPDRRVLGMLGAGGKTMAKGERAGNEKGAEAAFRWW